jgi:hypothetical protein
MITKLKPIWHPELSGPVVFSPHWASVGSPVKRDLFQRLLTAGEEI